MGALALGHGPAPRVPQDMGKSRCHWPERCEGQGSMALLSHWDLRAGSSGRSLPWESWLSWLARWWDSLGTVRWQAGAASSPAWAGLPWAEHPRAVPCGDGSSHPCSPGLPGQCAPSFPKLHKPPASLPFPTAAHPSTPHCTAGDGAQPQEWGVQQGWGYSGGWSVGQLRDVGHSER